jgi:hypothetical protein
MTMPKAAMNKDDSLVFGEDNVRLTRQILPMQTISEPQRMEMAANQHLGPGMLASD